MTKNLTFKIFFGLLSLTIVAAANNSAAAQRKNPGPMTMANLPSRAENERSARAHAEWLRRQKRIWAAKERQRLATERRAYEARRRDYAHRKSVADAVNKRNKSYAVRKRRPTTNRSSLFDYQPSNRREVTVTAIPVQ